MFPSPCPPTGSPVWEVRPPSDLAAPALPGGWRDEPIGFSGQGRTITALVSPTETPTRRVIVFGGIHGNEPVGPPAARQMVTVDVPDGIELWLVPDLNPDGTAAGTRCNAAGVDLNRNFSWRWRASTGGPGPFSEPESSAARDLVERLLPDLVVWIHQPLDYVSAIGPTADVIEQAWSAASGLPVRPDVSQHGGGESWAAFVAGRPSLLVEDAGWDATPEMVASQVAGLQAVLDVLGA
ncbi:MAG: M14 family zinc carboxypeptidase [Actinomycetota bacterium]